MPILALQRRARELGRIRLGQQESFTKRDGSPGLRPAKLERFRITSPSRPLIDKVAALYGGDVAPWTPKGGSQQYEVIVNETRLPILVPPQAVSQWLETWTGGGCSHRCDGVTNMLTDDLCDPDDPAHVNAKPTTRLNVVLRDVEGIGVFRLESHGWNAATELPFLADFLSQAGGYVRAYLGLEERVTKKIIDGKPTTNRFMVPTIEVDGLTPAQLLAGAPAVAAIGPAAPVPQIEAPPSDMSPADDLDPRVEALIIEIKDCETRDALGALWRRVLAERPTWLDGNDFAEWVKMRREDIDALGGKPAEPHALDEAWQQCIMAAGQLDPPMTLPQVETLYADMNGGEKQESASYIELVEFRDHLRGMKGTRV